MQIPLFDLTRQYNNIREEVLTKIDNSLQSGKVILGSEVDNLEKSISQLIGTKHAIGVANGSDALLISLAAMGVGKGDFIVTTAYTFFATASSIIRIGALPIFADIDPTTFNIDLDIVEDILQNNPNKEKIKAIIPVHLFGQSMDLERLEKISEKYGVKILEDCAQSIGAKWTYANMPQKMTGSIGDASTFSFFPTKNLGAYGDGGMILTDNDEIADFCRLYRVHGSKVKYVHDLIGINSRLDELQAVVLNIKLKHLTEYEEKRIEIAEKYNKWFSQMPHTEDFNPVCPLVPKDFSHVFHQYVVRFEGFTSKKRDELKKYLGECGIGTSVYYPMGLHLQKCFSFLNVTEGSLPETEKACRETLALPIFPEMKEEEIRYVVEKILFFI